MREIAFSRSFKNGTVPSLNKTVPNIAPQYTQVCAKISEHHNQKFTRDEKSGDSSSCKEIKQDNRMHKTFRQLIELYIRLLQEAKVEKELHQEVARAAWKDILVTVFTFGYYNFITRTRTLIWNTELIEFSMQDLHDWWLVTVFRVLFKLRMTGSLPYSLESTPNDLYRRKYP